MEELKRKFVHRLESLIFGSSHMNSTCKIAHRGGLLSGVPAPLHGAEADMVGLAIVVCG